MRLCELFQSDLVKPLERGVYLLFRPDDGLYKIGMSERLPLRVTALAGAKRERAQLVHTVRTERPRELEALLHRIYRAARVEGEWFRLQPGDVEFICGIRQWPREGER